MYGAEAAYFLPRAVADPVWSEPESAPGPRIAGATRKSGGFATLATVRSRQNLCILEVEHCMLLYPDAQRCSLKWPHMSCG